MGKIEIRKLPDGRLIGDITDDDGRIIKDVPVVNKTDMELGRILYGSIIVPEGDYLIENLGGKPFFEKISAPVN